MSITVSSIITYLDDVQLDNTSGAIDQNQRIRAIDKAIGMILRYSNHPGSIRKLQFNYYDSISEYPLASSAPDHKDSRDLRREDETLHDKYWDYDEQDYFAYRLGSKQGNARFTIESRDSAKFLRILFNSKYPRLMVHDCESLTSNGTWTADTSGSDATNLTLDTVEFKQGTASLNFDVDVSQSVNNLSTIYNADMTAVDLSTIENLGAGFVRVYIPSTTNLTSFTLKWTDQTSATPSTLTRSWSQTVTTDYAGNAFTAGAWNILKFDWASATMTGTPDSSAIVYLQLSVNYSASYVDQTDFRIDDIFFVKPEKLNFFYYTFYHGRNTSGTWVARLSSSTDVPFYSGYDESLLDITVNIAAKWLSHMNNDDGNFSKFDKEVVTELRQIMRQYPNRKRHPGSGRFGLRGIRGPRMGR